MPGFFTCGPEEVMVKSGFCNGKPVLLRGGGKVFVWPFLQRLEMLSLSVMTMSIKSERIYTKKGVALSIESVAQVKFDSTNTKKLLNACQMFLGMDKKRVQEVVRETLEGHQRAIMGRMTVTEIYQDRLMFAKGVKEGAESEMDMMGIRILSYQIKDVADEVGYLHNIGIPRTVEVQANAAIGKAEAEMESAIKKARANQDKMRAKYLADINIAESKRDLAIKQAGYKIETDTKKAEAKIAYKLQTAKSQQEVVRQEMQIKVIEKEKDIQIQEQNVLRQVARLEAEVKKPAEAEKYRMETTALAEKNKKLLEAEAEAEAIEIRAKADAAAMYMTGKAEAEAMELKANAFKEYKEAAMVKMVVDALPKIAKSCASPLMHANKITMVAGDNGDVGAERMTQEVLNIMAAMPDTIEKMTGINPFGALQTSSA